MLLGFIYWLYLLCLKLGHGYNSGLLDKTDGSRANFTVFVIFLKHRAENIRLAPASPPSPISIDSSNIETGEGGTRGNESRTVVAQYRDLPPAFG